MKQNKAETILTKIKQCIQNNSIEFSSTTSMASVKYGNSVIILTQMHEPLNKNPMLDTFTVAAAFMPDYNDIYYVHPENFGLSDDDIVKHEHSHKFGDILPQLNERICALLRKTELSNPTMTVTDEIMEGARKTAKAIKLRQKDTSELFIASYSKALDYLAGLKTEQDLMTEYKTDNDSTAHAADRYILLHREVDKLLCDDKLFTEKEKQMIDALSNVPENMSRHLSVTFSNGDPIDPREIMINISVKTIKNIILGYGLPSIDVGRNAMLTAQKRGFAFGINGSFDASKIKSISRKGEILYQSDNISNETIKNT